MAADRPEVHLRMLVSDDADWLVEVDRATASGLARGYTWDVDKLAAELDEGVWASDDDFGWAIVVDGEPAGFTLVTGLSGEDARMSIRIAPRLRGRGVGREVLRQLADHHFQANPHLLRLTGRAHEHNVPMQRAFNAAGFRMEARYRESYRATPDGPAASEWGYALTRRDWEAGRHRLGDLGYDLHGLWFEVDQTIDGPQGHGLRFKFLQEGRRAIARYDAHRLTDGELAGIVVGDVIRYRFVHTEERRSGGLEVMGRGRARLQRRGDGRLEVVDEWSDDTGSHGRRVLVERRDES
ncbi:GNAT family N-acetyltransferase [Egicoccus halophilus]|uniref:GNAT family N-acetyltransferase n=1 Tax=Egicoccus halophilus TaxID=1670830 RepID=UPI001030DBAB|nr:GNAT family protein [Egicoccus halophilus]